MPKETEIKLGFDINSCKQCSKNKIGTKIYEYFDPQKPNLFITYRDGICYLNEQVLMSIIKMVNPHQEDRKIKLVSKDEFKEVVIGKGR